MAMGRWILAASMLILGALGTAWGLAGCERKGSGVRPAGPMRIVVTVAPLAGLVRALAPAEAEVRVLMAPGRSEHGQEFGPDELTALGRADVVVMVGMMLEPKVDAFLASHPDAGRQVVDFGRTVGLAAMHDAEHEEAKGGHEGHDHATGDGHERHDHGDGDPHLWLDPVLVTQVVPAIRSAIQTAGRALGKDDAGRLEAAERELIAQVLKVDDEYREGLESFKGRGIVTHHAAWGRLAERYDLTVAEVLRPVESVEPDAAHTAAVVEALKKAGTGVLFVEPAYDRRSAERIAKAAGARVMVLDPIGDGDWFGMMRGNLRTLAEAFSSEAGAGQEGVK